MAFSRSCVAPIFEKHQLTSNHWIEALVRKGRTVPPSPDQSHGCLCSVGLPISEEDHIFKRMWNSVIWEVIFVGTVCFLLYLRCKENPPWDQNLMDIMHVGGVRCLVEKRLLSTACHVISWPSSLHVTNSSEKMFDSQKSTLPESI